MQRDGVARAGVVLAIVVIVDIVEAAELAEDAEVNQVRKMLRRNAALYVLCLSSSHRDVG